MPIWDSAEVRRILADLAAAEPYQPQYQRRQDGYRLNPPIAPATLDELETRWGVTLPEPYRSFVLEVGDGGAGPGPCGLFRIDRSDLGRDYDEAELDRAFFAAPWPHAGPGTTTPLSPRRRRTTRSTSTIAAPDGSPDR